MKKCESLSRSGKHKEAIKLCDKILEIDNKNAEGWFLKSVSLGNMNKRQEALNCLGKASELGHSGAEVLYMSKKEIDDEIQNFLDNKK